MDTYDVAIVGAGPGGLACAIKAKEMGLSYVVLEKGESILQGIIDSYPSGKKVYPTIPKGQSEHFPMPDLEPSNEPVEKYVAKVKSCIAKHEIAVRLSEDASDIVKEEKGFKVVTSQNEYECANVVLAFGRSIPADLGVYGDATQVRRHLDNPDQHIGNSVLVIGGGFAGCFTALACAERGLQVALIERRSYLGREVTAKLRPWIKRNGFEQMKPKFADILFPPGENLAFVGHTGAGKSSLVKLILRYYEFQSGSLQLDGIDIRNMDLKGFREQVGVVSQSPFLFSGTVADNIRYLDPRST